MAKDGELTIMAVGDVSIRRANPASAFEHVAAVLKQGDINLCNQESVLCDRGQPIPGKYEVGSGHSRSAPSNVEGLVAGRFKAVALANNHNMDYGAEGLLQMLEVLDKAGIAHAGGGRNLKEAHQPAIIEQNGIRVALLSNTSVYIPVGYPAEENKPGLATLKIHTSYETPENIFYQPGYPPIIITTPDPIELEMMLEDIREAKKIADIVVVYPHWGISWGYGRVAGYQKMAGRAAIDAGADLVMGNHPHRLQGMEMYKGKLLCYSLGNFAMEGGGVGPTSHFGWETVIVKCYVRNKQIVKCNLIPAKIDSDSRAVKLVTHKEGAELAKSLEAMSEEFGTTFVPEGDEITVGGPKPGTPKPPAPMVVLADTLMVLPYLKDGKPYERKHSMRQP